MTSLRIALFPLLAVLAAPPVPPAHRVVEQHWPDGSLRERKQVLVMRDGTSLDDGVFARWYVDGTKEYEAVFVRGKKTGTTVRYHRNGQVAARQQYRDGRRNGSSVSWNPDGEKVMEENWSDGRPAGRWTVWNEGRLAWTHVFDHQDP